MSIDYSKLVENAVRAAPAIGNGETRRAAMMYAGFATLHGEAMNAQESLRSAGRTLVLTCSAMYNSLELKFENRYVEFRLGTNFSITVRGSYGFCSHEYGVADPQEAARSALREIERAVKFLSTGVDPAKRDARGNLYGF